MLLLETHKSSHQITMTYIEGHIDSFNIHPPKGVKIYVQRYRQNNNMAEIGYAFVFILLH